MSRNLLRLIARLVLLLGGSLLSTGLSSAADEPKNPPAPLPAQILRDDDALKEFRRLGATVESGNKFTGNSDGIHIVLAAEWHGTPADFKLLTHVTNLERLSVHGMAITDDDLKQLDSLSRLSVVELYGTKVTADGAARLAEKHPGIHIESRGNARLGVAAQTEPTGCRITLVQDGSAADRAGLKADDIIMKFQDHEIPDFVTLIGQIGACQAGDKVTIELRHGSEVLKKEVKLGSWK